MGVGTNPGVWKKFKNHLSGGRLFGTQRCIESISVLLGLIYMTEQSKKTIEDKRKRILGVLTSIAALISG